jgi:hypothetical protein
VDVGRIDVLRDGGPGEQAGDRARRVGDLELTGELREEDALGLGDVEVGPEERGREAKDLHPILGGERG